MQLIVFHKIKKKYTALANKMSLLLQSEIQATAFSIAEAKLLFLYMKNSPLVGPNPMNPTSIAPSARSPSKDSSSVVAGTG